METSQTAGEGTKNDYYYFPGCRKNWRMISHYSLDKISSPMEVSVKGVLKAFNLVGFCSYKDDGQNLRTLLKELGVGDRTNKVIIEEVKAHLTLPTKHPLASTQIPNPKITSKKSEQFDWSQILYDAIYTKRSLYSVAFEHKVDRRDLLRKIRLHRKNLKMVKRDNLRFLNKRTKKTPEAVELCRRYCEANRYVAFSAHDVKSSLDNYEEIKMDLSASTVRRILKEDLHMSFKKANRIHPKIGCTDNKRELLEALSTQIALLKRGTIIIYLDEFSYSAHQASQYAWVRKGDPGHYKAFPSSFHASFMLAVSRTSIHGIMATAKTYNKDHFKLFLSRLATSMEGEYAFVLDNASIHSFKKIKKFCTENEIGLIFIPPYCPFVNMCEKVILNIKLKVRRRQRQGGEITLSTFRKIIDEITVKELLSCERSSFEDTVRIVT